MIVTRNEIIAGTMACMEELPPVWEGIVTQSEGVTIDRYIDAKIGEVLREIALVAPTSLLWQSCVEPAPTPQQRQDGSGRIVLPCEVMRPVSLLMQGWQRPVTQFATTSSAIYPLQQSGYSRGGTAKPVAVVTTTPGGETVIEYYSLPPWRKEHRVEQLIVVTYPDDEATSYDLNPLIVDALHYRCAAAVYDITGNAAMAQRMLAHDPLQHCG